MRSGSGGALLGAVDLLGEKAKVKIGHDAPWKGIEILRKMIKKKN
jgi:Na+/H+ antiporter NhaB